MKNSMAAILLSFGLFSIPTTPAYAEATQTTPVQLFTVTSDAFSDPILVSLTVDSQTNSTTNILYTNKGENTVVSLSDLPNGAVLYEMDGIKAAVLSSKSFDPSKGGPLTITYLHDILDNSYGTFNFTVTQSGQNWTASVTDANGVPHAFTKMYFTANKLFGKVIGVNTVTVQ